MCVTVSYRKTHLQLEVPSTGMKGWHNGTMKHVHRIYLSLKVRLHHGVLRSIVAWDSWDPSSILSHSHLMCLESPTVHVTPLHGLHADQPGRLQGVGIFKIFVFNMEKRSPSLSTAVVNITSSKAKSCHNKVPQISKDFSL